MAFFAGLAKGLGTSSWSWFFMPPPPGPLQMAFRPGFLNLSPTPEVAGVAISSWHLLWSWSLSKSLPAVRGTKFSA